MAPQQPGRWVVRAHASMGAAPEMSEMTAAASSLFDSSSSIDARVSLETAVALYNVASDDSSIADSVKRAGV